MPGGYADLIAGFTFLFAVSIISFAYIGRKIIEKQGCPSECGSEKKEEVAERLTVDEKSEEKEEVAERLLVEKKAGPLTATPERGFNYDVFISFRGKDTRNGFTSHLYEKLQTHGIATFIDNKGLKKGEKISDLITHIEGSKIFMPVFSKNYAESKWCLREIAKMVEINKNQGEERPIIPIFYELSPFDVKDPMGSFGKALEEHRCDKRLSKEQIKEWRDSLTIAGKISGFCLSDAEGNEAKLIRLISKEVSNRLCKVPFDIKPIGIGPHVETLKQMLERKKDGICMIGICGLGGIGKTTLAKVLYNHFSLTIESSCFLSDIREHDNRKNLPSLQGKLMKDVLKENVTIGDVEQGVSLMKQRLRSKNVLLVLDDVDHTRQLDAFTAKHGEMEGWFGEGSKIIVTTRDEKVLTNHGLQKNDIYSPEGLDVEHSLNLFCHHAFRWDQPLTELQELSQEVVEVAKGLPLALIVFGSHFYGFKEKHEWKEMLAELKRDQHKDVHERLKISYEGLNHKEKCVFLDIACFFIQSNKAYPVYMWEACGYSPGITLKILEHKSLIKINEDGCFEMHDQIRDMGIMVVKEEGNFDPLKYSRPWNEDQLLEVLRDAEVSVGNPHVQGILFYNLWCEEIKMSWKVIAAMPGLRIITGAYKDHGFEDEEQIIRLPSNTRWFQWMDCPYQMLTLHNNRHEKLCILDLYKGHFRDFGSHSMKFPNLKVLNLSGCEYLIRTPDFTHLPSLEVLVLDNCCSLAEVDESIKHLKKLMKLSMEGCKKLKGLPAGPWKLASLEYLDLSNCESLRDVPDSLGNLNDNLQISIMGCSSLEKLPNSVRIRAEPMNAYYENAKLDGYESFSRLHNFLGNQVRLDGCQSLRSLPDSVCYGMSVHWLSFRNCELLEEIPDSIGMRLECLKVLNLSGCTSLRRILPESIGELRSLSHLSLRGCRSIEELPECTGRLLSLEELVLSGCTSLKSIPESIGDLKSLSHLSLSGCGSIEELPECIGRLSSLEKLILSDWPSLKNIPEPIGDLKSLKHLDLKDCRSLQQLPECCGRLLSLEELVLSNCTSLKSIPESIGDLKSLSHLSLSGCCSIEELPQCTGSFLSLEKLVLSGCTLLTRIPESMGNMKNLKCLSLKHCQSLKELPECIGRLLSLEELDLSGYTSLKSIPESIGDLKSLSHLNLSGCRSIKELPECTSSLLSLEKLFLSYCTLLTRIPESMANLENLKHLSLKHCQSLEELPECIGRLLSLEELNLSGCTSLRKIPESIGNLKKLMCLNLIRCPSLEELPESMEGLESLEDLSICGGMSVKKVPDFIGKLNNLQTLSLMGFEEISESYGGFPSSHTELVVFPCSALRKLPDFSTLQELCLIDGDGLSRDLMHNLVQASFEQLRSLLIPGTSEGSELLFGLPKAAQVKELYFIFCLTEELPSNESRINVPIQVLVEGKIVTEAMCTAETTKIDYPEPEELAPEVSVMLQEMLGVEGNALYAVSLEEDEEIIRYIPKEGHANLRVHTAEFNLRMAHLLVEYS